MAAIDLDVDVAMRARDTLVAACQGVASHGLRSALAALGIAIGVAATIALAMVMQSLVASLNRQFDGLGARTLTARADTPFDDALRGHVNHLKTSDVEAMTRWLPQAIDVTPILAVAGPFGGPASYRGRRTVARVFATTGSYARLHGLFATSGRFLADGDDARHRRVCVIGDQTRRDLGLGEHPEGVYLTVLGEWFKIVGVLEKRGPLFGIARDDDVFIPYQTGLALVPPDASPDLVLSFNAGESTDVETLQADAQRVLHQAHRLRASQKDDFLVETADQLRETYAALSAKLTLGLSAVVGLSLIVSGIGILNIMFVSVTERTREIGIMKAVGARDADVLVQFLLEAVLITLAGCAVGLLAGLGAGALLVTAMPDAPPAAVPWGACALATLVATFVGLVFGVIPARRASALTPVEALRYE